MSATRSSRSRLHGLTITALIVAGPAGTILCVATLLAWTVVTASPDMDVYVGPLPELLVGLAVLVTLGLTTALLGLLPLHLLLAEWKLRTSGIYLLGGGGVGAIGAAISWGAIRPLGNFSEWMLAGTAIGFSSAFLFWLIRRPDRDLTPPPSPQTGAS